MGVNDLAEDWLYGSTIEEALFLSGDPHCEAYGSAANDLQELTHTAWKPLSKPPTEEDGHQEALEKVKEDINKMKRNLGVRQ